jgi:hypothetical protein
MPEARHEVTIRRPVGEVFAFVADGLNGPKWRSGILDIAHISGSSVGATTNRASGSGWPPGGCDCQIGFRAEHPARVQDDRRSVRPTGEYRLEDVDGGTRLTFALRAELGGLKKLVMGGAVQRRWDPRSRRRSA